MNGSQHRRVTGDLTWGLLLIAVGVVALLAQLGQLPADAWRRGWPLLLVVMALGQLVTGYDSPRRVGSAVTMALVGGWFLVVQAGWHGLRLSNSWPLALVAVGAGTMVRALLTRLAVAKEDRDASAL